MLPGVTSSLGGPDGFVGSADGLALPKLSASGRPAALISWSTAVGASPSVLCPITAEMISPVRSDAPAASAPAAAAAAARPLLATALTSKRASSSLGPRLSPSFPLASIVMLSTSVAGRCGAVEAGAIEQQRETATRTHTATGDRQIRATGGVLLLAGARWGACAVRACGRGWCVDGAGDSVPWPEQNYAIHARLARVKWGGHVCWS